MEEIVIIDEKFKEKKSYKPIVLSKQDDADYPHSIDCGHNGINMTASEAKQLAFGLLQHLGISITDIERQAFEAAREGFMADDGWQSNYDTFTDYQNREK